MSKRKDRLTATEAAHKPKRDMAKMVDARHKKWERSDEIVWLKFFIAREESALVWYIASVEGSIARHKQMLEYYLELEQQWWDRFLNYCHTGK